MIKKIHFCLVLFLMAFSSAADSQNALEGKKFYVYNNTRASDGNLLPQGTRLYWTAGNNLVYLLPQQVTDNASQLWEFKSAGTDGKVYIHSVEQDKYLAGISDGGNCVEYSTSKEEYTMVAGTGDYEGAYKFYCGLGVMAGKYLFADNPKSDGYQYRLDGWKDDKDEYFYLVEYTEPIQKYVALTPIAERGSVSHSENVFTAVANDGFVFDYWSDGLHTWSEPLVTYTGSTPVQMTAFFKPQEKKDCILPPTMGWSSWNTYHAEINADNISSQADALVAKGLAAKGYRYVNIDDGFQNKRDSEGNLITDGNRFPRGLQPVADHIHSKGLLAGIYTDAGTNTCASNNGEAGGKGAGIYNHESQDCPLFFSDHRFDFIKVDYCGAGDQGLNPQKRYTEIKESIGSTGRNVQYNLCRWAYPGTWSAGIGDSWRTTGDIWSYWDTDKGSSFSVKTIIGENLYLSAYSSPGHYNDMDMLEVGVNRDGGQLTEQENKTHFSMWCVLDSPLLIGCDVNSISDDVLKILGNEELIAVNQDRVFQQSYVVKNDNGAYTLVKDLLEANGLTRAVTFYNPTDEARSMTVTFSDVDLGGACSVRNLTDRIDLGTHTDHFTASVPAHGAIVYKVVAEKRLTRTIYEAETAYCSAYNEIADGTSPTITEDANCSGGIKIGFVGKSKTDAYGNKVSNDLIWKNVYVTDDCDAEMEIAYISGENRTMKLMVNGTDIATLSCNSGSWSAVAKARQTVHLKSGNNEVRLYNDDAYMPDIDVMNLTSIIVTGLHGPDATAAGSSGRTAGASASKYDLSGRKTCLPAPGFRIARGSKVIRK